MHDDILTIGTPLKWTTEDGKSCHGGTHDWVQHPTLRVKGVLEPCKNGIHLATIPQAIQATWISAAVWTVEHGMKQIYLDDKIVVRECRVVRRLPWNRRLMALWACDCVERVIRDPESYRIIETARRYVFGQATRAEAIDDVANATHAALAVLVTLANANADATAERTWQAERLLAYLLGRLPALAEPYRAVLMGVQ